MWGHTIAENTPIAKGRQASGLGRIARQLPNFPGIELNDFLALLIRNLRGNTGIPFDTSIIDDSGDTIVTCKMGIYQCLNMAK